MPKASWITSTFLAEACKAAKYAVVLCPHVAFGTHYGSVACTLIRPISATEMYCSAVFYDPAFRWDHKPKRIRVHCFGILPPKSKRANKDGERELLRAAKLGRFLVLPFKVVNDGVDVYGSVSYAPDPADPIMRMRSIQGRLIEKGFAIVKLEPGFEQALNWKYMLEEQSCARRHRRGLWKDVADVRK